MCRKLVNDIRSRSTRADQGPHFRIITVYMIICITLYTGISIKHGYNKKTNNETPLLLDMDRSEE